MYTHATRCRPVCFSLNPTSKADVPLVELDPLLHGSCFAVSARALS